MFSFVLIVALSYHLYYIFAVFIHSRLANDRRVQCTNVMEMDEKPQQGEICRNHQLLFIVCLSRRRPFPHSYPASVSLLRSAIDCRVLSSVAALYERLIGGHV